DSITGGDGDDVLNGGEGADVLDGGAGIDTVSYEGNLRGLLVDLDGPHKNFGIAAGDSFLGIENLRGSEVRDNLRGGSVNNVLWGAGGSDLLYGQGGDDTLFGGDLNDLLTGGIGADVLIGGEGRDRAAYTYCRVDLLIDMANPGLNTGDGAGDRYEGIEGIAGSRRADQIFGDSADNFLFGNNGNDRIWGRDGRDYILGGAGDDWMDGGAGSDWLRGEDGADTFILTLGRDIIEDFDLTEGDRIGIDRSLTGGIALTGAQLALYASLVEGAIVLDLDGPNGLRLAGQTSLVDLADALFSI
ncbi:MAG: calcium-binding protein, partial [Paracoccaceae bacterium]